ncbi:unnamed protein product [Auanema sp. JU1783]|nr:unnamed protein product [Auanema sp. JU1783]
MSHLGNESCQNYHKLFGAINHFFRSEAIIGDSDYSSNTIGHIITVAYATVIIFGGFGNALTIFVVLQNVNMRTTRNFFILNLALSDLFVCLITAPLTLYTIRYMFWPFGTPMCKVVGSLQAFSVFLSTFSITAIALDRYVLVIFPTKRERQQRLSIIFFVLIWIISLVFAIPMLIASDVSEIYNDPPCNISLEICHEKNSNWDTMAVSKRTYTLSVLIVQYALPLASLVFAYSRIVNQMKLRCTNREMTSFTNGTAMTALSDRRRCRSIADRQRRTHLLLICIIGIFAIAWLPLNVFHMINTFQSLPHFSVTTFAFCHLIGMSSACLNPVSYAYFNHNLRAEFTKIVRSYCLRCTRQYYSWMGQPDPYETRETTVAYDRNRSTENNRSIVIQERRIRNAKSISCHSEAV